MKEQMKMGLMAVIAVALVLIAVKLFMDDSDKSTNSIAEKTTAAAAADPSTTFDPLSDAANKSATEVIDNTPKTTMTFESYDHDFGNIKQDTKNKKVFTFTNTGSEPLIIESAKGSCGCTVPAYPKNPIAPGETGEIEVIYSPGKQKALQNKNVTIVANTEPKQTTLRIKANVEEIPGASTTTEGSSIQIEG